MGQQEYLRIKFKLQRINTFKILILQYLLILNTCIKAEKFKVQKTKKSFFTGKPSLMKPKKPSLQSKLR